MSFEVPESVKPIRAAVRRFIEEINPEDFGAYAEALRVGDEQKAVMDRIMRLPDIENNWNQQDVMDRLYELASEAFGEQP